MNFNFPVYVAAEKVLKPSTFFFHSLKNGRKLLNNKGYTGAVLMDSSKAFDTINYELLIAILKML